MTYVSFKECDSRPVYPSPPLAPPRDCLAGHGTCSCGRGVCEKGWFGTLCQHPRKCNLTEEQSSSLCESADGILCSGKGEYLLELGRVPCSSVWFVLYSSMVRTAGLSRLNGNHAVLCSDQTLSLNFSHSYDHGKYYQKESLKFTCMLLSLVVNELAIKTCVC